MTHRKIGKVMTGDVVTVGPDAPFKEVARLLMEHRISGLPVIDDDEQVLGVISETDLMLHQAAQGVEEYGRRRRLPRLTRSARTAHRKARAETAAELMSAPAVTIHALETVTEAARTMAEHRIERLPVVDVEERLIGIVTRRDLLQVFVRADADLRADVVSEVLVRTLWLLPGSVGIDVQQGVVTLKGELERRSEAEIAARMTEKVDGVVSVVDELTYRIDDAGGPSSEPAVHGIADEWIRRL